MTPVVAVNAKIDDIPKATVAMPHMNQKGDGCRHVLAVWNRLDEIMFDVSQEVRWREDLVEVVR